MLFVAKLMLSGGLFFMVAGFITTLLPKRYPIIRKGVGATASWSYDPRYFRRERLEMGLALAGFSLLGMVCLLGMGVMIFQLLGRC